jgi:hypothetical protein
MVAPGLGAHQQAERDRAEGDTMKVTIWLDVSDQPSPESTLIPSWSYAWTSRPASPATPGFRRYRMEVTVPSPAMEGEPLPGQVLSARDEETP